jgi:ethanolamine utilization cobalamin adenosyltransferase
MHYFSTWEVEKQCISLAFIIRIYHYARSSECQMSVKVETCRKPHTKRITQNIHILIVQQIGGVHVDKQTVQSSANNKIFE